MNEPRWHPGAVVDAETARDWYAARSAIAARGFLLALEEAVLTVTEAPERWPEREFGCRGYVFPSSYPYTLVFRTKPTVEIVAVAHQRRLPDYWRAR